MFYSILVSHVAVVPETLVVDAAVQENIYSSSATEGSNIVVFDTVCTSYIVHNYHMAERLTRRVNSS